MTQEPSRLAPKRLTGSGPAPSIAFLIDWLGDSRYQWQLLRGVMQEAHDRRAHLLCFVGQTLAPPSAPNPDNAVFDLARPNNVDCVVALSGSLGNAVGVEGLRSFCLGYRPMPVCSIAVALPGVSSVCVDNESGIRAGVEHLIRVHGIKRVAFVRGPAASDEAEMRLRVYRETLANQGVPYLEELVVPGDFTQPAGRDAVTTLFTTRKLSVGDVGAIMAANDHMALGAMDQLRVLGIRIPEQVKVVGFDDVEEAAFALPPLTSVRQGMQEQGRDAVRMVLEQLRQGAKPEQSRRHTELVTRRSCGCLPALSAGRKSSGPPGSTLGFDSAIIRRRQHILAEMARAARGSLGAAGNQWDVRLLSAVGDQVRGDSPDAFLRAYDEFLRRLVAAGSDLSVCNDVLGALRSRVVRAISDPKGRAQAEDFFHEARVMTSHALEGIQVAKRFQTVNDARALLSAGAAILAAQDMDQLAHAVHEHLPPAGIARCFVIRFHEGAGQPGTARVVLAETPDARKADPRKSTTYPIMGVLRQVLLQGVEELAFAVFPVGFGNGDRGALALELGAVEGYGYETLRQVFASALLRMPG